jgi:hypothetical protein
MIVIVTDHVIGEPAFDILVQKGILGQSVDQIDQRQAHDLIMFEEVLV